MFALVRKLVYLTIAIVFGAAIAWVEAQDAGVTRPATMLLLLSGALLGFWQPQLKGWGAPVLVLALFAARTALWSAGLLWPGTVLGLVVWFSIVATIPAVIGTGLGIAIHVLLPDPDLPDLQANR